MVGVEDQVIAVGHVAKHGHAAAAAHALLLLHAAHEFALRYCDRGCRGAHGRKGHLVDGLVWNQPLELFLERVLLVLVQGALWRIVFGDQAVHNVGVDPAELHLGVAT